MFLFILESIGTSELILIAVTALIVFGPRKLPQMAKTIGKTMNEFRSATHEFKSTWAKEVAFEDENKINTKINPAPENLAVAENSIGRNASQVLNENQINAPQVKELTPEEIAQNFHKKEITTEELQTEENKSEKPAMEKREWL